MILSENVHKLINQQISNELQNSNLYFGFANWCENKSLFGFSALFYKQVEDERTHARKFTDYLNDKNFFYYPDTIPSVGIDFEGKGIVDFISLSLNQEYKTTESIYAIQEAAIQDKDHMSREFLNCLLIF